MGEMARGSNTGQRGHTFRIILGILFFSIFFYVGVNEAQAAPIKILSNSRHAYDSIRYSINDLLGRPHYDPLPLSEFVIHSTSMDDTFAGDANVALLSTSRYDESGVLVPSQAPYQLYTSSFSGYTGDRSASYYNTFASYDLVDNYAFISGSFVIPPLPPAFRVAPGNANFGSGAGVEWTLPPPDFASTSLSGVTAINAGIMAGIRFSHSTWNWFDVKAALRQTATNWATGYSTSTYGFGTISTSTANVLTDGQLLLQPPAVATSTSGIYSQITFTLYPFRQTRRVKDVLFQFSSNPGFQANELTLANIQALGGTKITEYTGTTATTTAPIYTAVTNAYFVWFTANNNTDSAANFSRIDTYNVLGPLSQGEVHFNSTFNISSPANNAISTSASPTFTWGAADSYLGISKYQLFIDAALNKDNISGTSATPTSNLSEGTHTWYVKAFNGGGTSTTTTSTPTININTAYASGYTFYIDNVSGSDNNTGSQSLPWATLTKAGNTVQAGDTVIIIKNASTPYRETLTPVNNGTAGSLVTFRGVDVNTKPEIWGSDDVSGGWSTYGGGNPNTYQKNLTTNPQIFAAGPSIGNLTKKTQGASAATLNPGEWRWTSSVLYYRLASGEDISTLHIEAGARSTGISGGSSTTYKNIIVRYAKVTGMSLRSNAIAEGLEIYDSGLGINIGSDATVRYSAIAGNNGYGIWSQYSSGVNIYNSLTYGNETSGVDVDTFGGSTATIKNNIFAGNTNYSFSFTYFFGVPILASSNNTWDIAGDSNWDTLKGTNNQELKDSLFVSTSTRNFRLQQFSPNIDAGVAISGLTTDILGNPIYGTPDIGPYEYQPPYIITQSGIPLNGSFRVYKDGKYRMTAATTSTATASLYITPEGGFSSGDYSEWLNVTVNTWNISGDYSKSWTESSPVTTTTAVHTIGDLAPNAFYAVNVDGVRYAQFRADGGGQGTFTYSGGYSTHTFTIAADFSIGNGPIVGSSFSAPDTNSQLASKTSSLATSTTLIATSTPSTTTPPNSTSSVIIKEKVAELQGKLIVLLKQLVVLLTEELQNITKTI
ncbi:MAG: right-handed parallel beta-helix repeat-containing protein [Candidatus Yonathbacteria bacterium]|nr:right-handed parallel beta-helix repeat-containing protein [Candidatus Yonathbacteria bacterium]